MKRFSKVLVGLLVMYVIGFQASVYVNASGYQEVVAVKAVYHTHLGVSGQTSRNGCYTVPQTKTETAYKKDMYSSEWWEGNYYIAAMKCSYCSFSGVYYKSETNPSTGAVTVLINNSPASAEHSHGGHLVDETVTRYYLGCGYSDNVPVGNIELTKSVDTSYVLSVKIPDTLTPVSYAWSNGSTSKSIEVTSNGSYSVDVKYKEGATQGSVHFDYVVSDYDTEPPVVTGVSYSSERGNLVDIIVNATDNMQVIEYKLEKEIE